jgi:uncharacterized protein (TIGR00369 family)
MHKPRYGIVPVEVMLSQDGYSYLDAMRRGEILSPPIYETLSLRLKEVERGRVVVQGTPGLRFYGPVNNVHVGFTSTVIQAALISAVQSALEVGEMAVPVEFKVNLVRPVIETTGPLDAIAMVLYRGRTVATAESKLVDGTGKLYAHASVTCTIMTPEVNPGEMKEG